MSESTLINRLLGEDRLLTGPEAELRDSIELPFTGRAPFLNSSIQPVCEEGKDQQQGRAADGRGALRAIRYAHLCVLLMDATEELHRQDRDRKLIAEEGPPLSSAPTSGTRCATNGRGTGN